MATTKKELPTSLSKVIKGETPVLADFYASWCGPCKMMDPILKDLKREMGDQLNIIKIDAEKNADAAIKYHVRGVPTLILFHKGSILWQQSGVVQLHQLKSTINEKLNIL